MIIDTMAKRKILSLKLAAEQFPLPSDILQVMTAEAYAERSRQLRAFIQNSTLTLGRYRVTYLIETHHYGKAKHITVAVDTGNPESSAVHVFLEAFDFQQPLNRCLVWEENFGKDYIAVNIIEPYTFNDAYEGELKKRVGALPVSV